MTRGSQERRARRAHGSEYSAKRRPGARPPPLVPGQVASQTRREGASNARRTWVYVERCWRAKTKYGEANWPSTPLLLHRAERLVEKQDVDRLGGIGGPALGHDEDDVGIAAVNAASVGGARETVKRRGPRPPWVDWRNGPVW